MDSVPMMGGGVDGEEYFPYEKGPRTRELEDYGVVECSRIFRGVHYNVKKRKWEARISLPTIGSGIKAQYLGAFDSEIDAAIAYNKRALAHYGPKAIVNEIWTLGDELTKEEKILYGQGEHPWPIEKETTK